MCNLSQFDVNSVFQRPWSIMHGHGIKLCWLTSSRESERAEITKEIKLKQRHYEREGRKIRVKLRERIEG